MFDIQREELDWCGRKLTLETGRVARQADGAVLATWGETTVLATVVAAKEPKPGQDFFPLTVHYQEKAFAAGRIPGGYLKREGRMSDRETLTSRLIDRPIRPLFPEDFRCDTQVIATVFSYDLENDLDILAMVAASAALTLSGVPVHGPDRRRARRPHQGRDQGQPDRRGDEGFDPRSGRRRHGGRGPDGRVGGSRALRGHDAEGGHGRPCRIPAGPSGDHPARRKGRQGAARTRRRRISRRSKRRFWKWARRISAPPIRSQRSRSVTPLSTRPRRRSWACSRPRAPKRSFPRRRLRRLSTTPRPRSCAGTFSTTSAASTGGI